MSEGIMVDYPYTSNYDLLTLLTQQRMLLVGQVEIKGGY